MDWLQEEFLKWAGLLGGAIAWAVQMKAKHLREKVEADLNILEKSRLLFGENDERTKRAELNVTRLMSYLYRDTTARTARFIPWSDITLALFCFAGAARFFFNYYFIKNTSYWGLGFALLLAFLGIGGVLNAWEKRNPKSLRSTSQLEE